MDTVDGRKYRMTFCSDDLLGLFCVNNLLAAHFVLMELSIKENY